MHLHKYEKYWLMFGIGSLIVFLLITGLMALNNSHETPNSQKTINPEKVSEIAPFLRRIPSLRFYFYLWCLSISGLPLTFPSMLVPCMPKWKAALHVVVAWL